MLFTHFNEIDKFTNEMDPSATALLEIDDPGKHLDDSIDENAI